MKAIAPTLLLVAAAASTFVGCASAKRSFRINSFPQGATIFVNDEPRGHTNAEKLVIDFDKVKSAVLRLEREGYQSNGLVLFEDSDQEVTVFLQESPNNEEILKELGELRRQLDQIWSAADDPRGESKDDARR
jgi:hypothetical protein